ncbi:hypothetical protein SAMN04487996_12274 [Dyadobacter soli]|uniref:Uncharacterized protein n=1 Tax=Dyadobacter soli TaxID=659014 RepID=A0A1G7WLX2_9BACT|nr:DUF6712 family protein [Dyadobacter soli]SDG72220.1 hypothetical protein SAMN04487996_12274 [Dyadobacter soli]
MIVELEQLKKQLGGVQAKLNFETVLSFVKNAEREFRKVVGVELYDFLEDAAFEDLPELDRVSLEELLDISQGCIAWTAYDMALPHLKFRVGDLGLAKNSPSQTVAVAKWEYVDTRDANMAMVDLMWELFWENLEQTKPEAWTSSPAYQARNQYFIRGADELGDYVPLAGRNRRLFSQLEKFIRRAEQLYIREAITYAVFDELKIKWQDKDAQLTPLESMLVDKIKEPLSFLTLHEAYPYLPIKLDENGPREVRKWDGITNESPAGEGIKNAQRQQLWQDAQLYMGRLQDFMDKYSSPTQFPEYYTANVAIGIDELEDFTNKSHVIL